MGHSQDFFLGGDRRRYGRHILPTYGDPRSLIVLTFNVDPRHTCCRPMATLSSHVGCFTWVCEIHVPKIRHGVGLQGTYFHPTCGNLHVLNVRYIGVYWSICCTKLELCLWRVLTQDWKRPQMSTFYIHHHGSEDPLSPPQSTSYHSIVVINLHGENCFALIEKRTAVSLTACELNKR